MSLTGSIVPKNMQQRKPTLEQIFTDYFKRENKPIGDITDEHLRMVLDMLTSGEEFNCPSVQNVTVKSRFPHMLEGSFEFVERLGVKNVWSFAMYADGSVSIIPDINNPKYTYDNRNTTEATCYLVMNGYKVLGTSEFAYRAA